MALKDIARELPEEIWAVFEPTLPRVIWCGNGRPPKGNANASTPCSTSWSAASPGRCCRPASPRTNPPAAAQAVAGARRLPHRLARTGQAVRAARWDQGVLSRVVFGRFSGGGLLRDAIDEDRPLDDLGQQRRTIQGSPTL